MEFLTSPSPADLTGAVRLDMQEYDEERSTLAQFLPNMHINSNVAKVRDLFEGQGEAAELRSFDAEAPVGKAADSVRALTFELPPISQKLRVSEMDQLRSIADPQLASVVGMRAVQVGRAVADRMELFRGEVLATGKIHVDGENGVYADVDFGRSAEMEPTTGTSWEDAAAKPLSDLVDWLEAYSDKNGSEASTLVLSARALRKLMTNKEITGSMPDPKITRANPEMVRGLLAEFGITEVITYDRKIAAAGGVRSRVLPVDKALLLPSSQEGVGRTVFGTTVEAADASYGYGIAPEDSPGIVVGSWRQQDPAGVWVRGNAIGAPVLLNPDLVMAATISG